MPDAAHQQTHTALATISQQDNRPPANAGFFNAPAFELMQRVATAFSKSSLVPKDYQNNIPNCMIALSIAERINADPMMVMQNLVIVHGRPGFTAQFLIGTANACGRFSAIRFEFFGEPNTDGWGCRAWAIEKSTNEKLVGSDITIKMAKDEGWYQKTGSKWKTMAQQMLIYRAGSWWVRAYAPELSMGMHTQDEIIDMRQEPDGRFRIDLTKAAKQLGAEPATEIGDYIERAKLGFHHAANSGELDEFCAVLNDEIDSDESLSVAEKASVKFGVKPLYEDRIRELIP